MTELPGLNGPTPVLRAFMDAWRWMKVPSTRHYFIWPILINLLVYVLAFMLAAHYFEQVINYLLPSWLDFVRWLLWPLFAAAFLLLVYMSATVLVNIAGAPFYGLLAERVWLEMHGSLPATHTSSQGFIRSLQQSAGTEWQRLRAGMKKMLPLLLLSCVPGLNVLAAPLWLLYTLWFMAAEYLAYPMEIMGLGFTEQQQYLVRRAIGVFSFGGMVTLLLLVPLLNLVVPPLSVVAATLLLGAPSQELASIEGDA